jgi:hypothetical protein
MRKTLAVLAIMLATGARAFDAAPLLSFFDYGYTPPAGCVVWVEGDYGVETNGAGNVVAWRDRSGSANDFTNITSTVRLAANAKNGLPALQFGSLDSYLRSASFSITGDHTFIIVAAWTNRTVGDTYMCEVSYYHPTEDRAGPHYIQWVDVYAGAFPLYPGGGYYLVAAGEAQAANTWYVYTLPYANNATWSGYVNGVLQGTVEEYGVGSAGVTGLVLGRQLPSRFWTGYISAVMFWNRKLTNPEIDNVHSYLAARWGITVSKMP